MTPTLTEDDVLTQVRVFLDNVAPGVPVFRGQANRVPEPKSADFIVMTPTNRVRLATTLAEWDTTSSAPTAMIYTEPTRVEIQLDLHGEQSTDIAQAVTTLWRSPYATEMLAGSGVSPLFSDDGKQMPFINAEDQYEDRWVITLACQVSPGVSTTQQFAHTLTPTLVEVDSTYPPGAH